MSGTVVPAAAARSGERIVRAVGSAYTAAPGHWAPASRPGRAVGGGDTGRIYDDVRKEGAQDGDSRSALTGAGRGWRGVPGAGAPNEPAAGTAVLADAVAAALPRRQHPAPARTTTGADRQRIRRPRGGDRGLGPHSGRRHRHGREHPLALRPRWRQRLMQTHGAAVAAGAPEAAAIARRDPGCCAAEYLDQPVAPYTVDLPLHDKQVLRLGDTDWQTLSTPGHTPGHLALWQ